MKPGTLFPTFGIVASLAASIAGFPKAQAATLTVTGDLVGSQTNKTASIQKFDTSLGTLNFVRILYDLSATARLSLENPLFTAQLATIEENSIEVRGHEPDDFFGNTENQLLRSQDFGQDVLVPAARTFANVVILGRQNVGIDLSFVDAYDSRGRTFSNITIGQFDKNTYVGPGNFDFVFNAAFLNPVVFTGANRAIISDRVPTLTGTVSVTYDFTEAVTTVPVPAAMPLLAVALGALGLAARRKRTV